MTASPEGTPAAEEGAKGVGNPPEGKNCPQYRNHHAAERRHRGAEKFHILSHRPEDFEPGADAQEAVKEILINVFFPR